MKKVVASVGLLSRTGLHDAERATTASQISPALASRQAQKHQNTRAPERDFGT